MAPVSKPKANQDAFDKALGYVEEAEAKHGEFVQGVERRYKSWRGIMQKTSEAAQWTSKQAPPYINHIVESSIASMIDDNLRYRIRPRPTLATLEDPNAMSHAKLGAEAHQVLHDWQVRRSKFSRVQRPFVLQNAIAGLTVAKTYWVQETQRRRIMVPVEQQLLDDHDEPILHPNTGAPMTVPTMKQEVRNHTVYDGPVTEVRDVRDFLWHESATSLERSRYVIDRVWVDKEDIEAGIREGQFGPAKGGWTEKQISELLGTGSTQTDKLGHREMDVFSVDRTKDLIELCEVWDQVERKVVTLANRAALLAYRDFPFFHERTPFVVCSTQPDLFRIPGISQVEKIEALQNLLWSLINQRIDNLQLINNAIFWFRPDIEDIDEYQFEPGARWPVEDPTQVQMWTPSVIPAEVSLGAEGLLKGDLQNLAGGFPFSSGTDSQNVDQKTATGASIISSLAQRSINLAKGEVYDAWEDVGQQRIILNQQFITEPTVAPVLGLDNEEELRVILPELLHGDFEYEQEPVADALMKQEEQASAQALIQLAVQLVPVTVMLAQSGNAKALNMDAFVEDLLRAFGKDDVERYFSKNTPAMPAQPPAGNQPPGAPPAAGDQPPQGVTGPNSIDPSVSPSAQVSSAPTTLLQRAQALSGGGQNVQNG